MLLVPSALVIAFLAGATTVTAVYGPTGNSPVAIAWDPVCGYVFTANAGGTVPAGAGSGLSYLTPAGVLTNVAQGQSIHALAVDPTNGYVYLVDGAVANVYIYSCPAGGPVSFLAVYHTPCLANALAFDPQSLEMWATCPSNGFAFWLTAAVVPPAIPVMGSAIPIPGGSNALAYDPANGDMLIASTPVNTVSAIASSGAGLNTIVWTKAVGTAPLALAYDASDSYMYVVNEVSGTVSVLKPTGASAGTVTVGSLPVAVSYNNASGHIFVANSGTGTVSDILGTTLQATVTVGTSPIALTNDSADTDMYVLNSNSGTVSVISPSDTVVATLTAGANPTAGVYSPTTVNVYIANTNANTLSELPSTVATPVLATGTAPYGLAESVGTGYMFASLTGSNAIESIAPTNALVSTVPFTVGQCGPGPTAIAGGVGGAAMYAVCTGSDTVVVVSGTGTYVTTINIAATYPTFHNPIAIALDPTMVVGTSGTGDMIVGSASSPYVVAISVALNAPVALIATSTTTPTGLLYDSLPTSDLMFIAEPGVPALQTVNNAAVAGAALHIGVAPTQMALDTPTGNVWAVAPAASSVAVVNPGNTVRLNLVALAGSGADFVTYDPTALAMAVSAPTTNAVDFVTTGAYGISTIPLAGATPGPSVFDSVDSRLYVVETATGNVAELLASNPLSVVVMPIFALATPTGQADIQFSAIPGNLNVYYLDSGATPPTIWDI
ncbi:MAG: YncE family protein [Thermoplasmata archaeon]|nr:YncE family protein [Thermoplasmata archaeon]